MGTSMVMSVRRSEGVACIVSSKLVKDFRNNIRSSGDDAECAELKIEMRGFLRKLAVEAWFYGLYWYSFCTPTGLVWRKRGAISCRQSREVFAKRYLMKRCFLRVSEPNWCPCCTAAGACLASEYTVTVDIITSATHVKLSISKLFQT